jgi:hypothetical protein
LNAVTVATSMAGRGTDIKLSKEVHDLGGLTARATFCAISKLFGICLLNNSLEKYSAASAVRVI